MNEQLEKVAALKLPQGDYAIFGSGPLLVRGIIDTVNDIDIICRGAAWEKGKAIGELVHLDEYDVDIVAIDDGLITLGRSWGIGDLDVQQLIDSAEEIDGLPFVLLRYVVEYKEIADRLAELVPVVVVHAGLDMVVAHVVPDLAQQAHRFVLARITAAPLSFRVSGSGSPACAWPSGGSARARRDCFGAS